jgi:hypothetical protein
MTSEIIPSVAYDNYDDFQHVILIIFKIYIFTILRRKIVSGHKLLSINKSTNMINFARPSKFAHK